MFAPGDSQQLDLLYETGVKDATLWAVEQGLLPIWERNAMASPFAALAAKLALSMA